MIKQIFKKYLFNTKSNKIRRSNIYNSLHNIAYINNCSGNFDVFTSEPNNGYTGNVIAYRSIRMIATGISSVNLEMYRKEGQSSYKIDEHSILRLLKNPNNRTSGVDFMESLISWMLINGNVYLLKLNIEDSPVELHVLNSDKVRILTSDNSLIGYRYTAGKEIRDYLIDSKTNESDILHIKIFNPINDIYGLSPMSVANTSIVQHNYATQWNCSLLKNSARPSGALVVKNTSNDSLSEEQYLRIREQIDELYSGHQNSGKPLLLEGGLEWKEMSISPKDMDFVGIKNTAARDISLSFGVPPQMLGIPGDNTYSNLIEARTALWEQTILPILDKVLSCLNSWLLKDQSVYLSYNKDDIGALASRREKIWSYINNADFITKNEKRKLMGFDPMLDQEE